MAIKKRTAITIETDRTIVIRAARNEIRSWCDACERSVAMTTIDAAAGLARVSSRTIYRWVEDERLHFFETSDGRLLVCCESIPPIEPGRRENQRESNVKERENEMLNTVD